jgi:hypothetical protein
MLILTRLRRCPLLDGIKVLSPTTIQPGGHRNDKMPVAINAALISDQVPATG